jgi:hypothetical protein
MREDGFLLHGYSKGRPIWVSPGSYNRAKISSVVSATKKRAIAHGVPHSIDADYLESVFPTDFICPVLGIEMSWGQIDGRNSCPSVDRICPSKGYVPGNVAWISLQANRLKNNATLPEMEKIIAYMRRYEYGEESQTTH